MWIWGSSAPAQTLEPVEWNVGTYLWNGMERKGTFGDGETPCGVAMMDGVHLLG